MLAYIQILFLILAYLIGAIPFALVISKAVKGIDIREYGSKNMGATNTFRVLGFKWGLIVFLLDCFKGFIIVFLMKYNIFRFDYESFNFFINPLFYGICAFLGHLYPVYTKFKGGKGVSTASGILLAYNPICFGICILTFIISALITRYVSISSCITAIAAIITTWIFPIPFDYYQIIIVNLFAVFIIVKHIPNLYRVFTHKESKLNLKSFKDDNEPAFITPDSTDEEKKENK